MVGSTKQNQVSILPLKPITFWMRGNKSAQQGNEVFTHRDRFVPMMQNRVFAVRTDGNELLIRMDEAAPLQRGQG